MVGTLLVPEKANEAIQLPTGVNPRQLFNTHEALRQKARLFAALDLGTNNCRLIVAQRASKGFRVIDSFSRVVRLGENLSLTGHLSERAMQRTIAAITTCAKKLARHQPDQIRCVATQACRAAKNGPSFLRELTRITGISFEIIDPQEEARLAVLGCADLFNPDGIGALVIDIGGGSTELSWALYRGSNQWPRLESWYSAPIGVVTLADQFPEIGEIQVWYRSMKRCASDHIARFTPPPELTFLLESGKAHIVGTSGAITSLAGVHLNLPRYSRRLVDGLWMCEADTRTVINRLISLSKAERALEPCIGPDRADLVLAGAAILEAVLDRWPSRHLRVADRGLREGLILTMLNPQHWRQ
ncbi:Ppx/GppA phosphatase family protein [Candidatus Phycosocius spiralis]|uniref:Exopolyphosphatase n=1 Tax=Candidatus Phycosocius spiralis TaxID=2815099 RepID=A0ABQ4PSR2_9PROT|nr:Ppx/GppA phosphatase family protein [Candidatus Phycosocius spiralis]GIU66021.1 exopolyphosphatase [Candidatus Phycosocius spiralis]